jgi:hypothetical protein
VIQAVKEARLQKLVPTNRKYIRGYEMRMSVHSNMKSKEYKSRFIVDVPVIDGRKMLLPGEVLE